MVQGSGFLKSYNPEPRTQNPEPRTQNPELRTMNPEPANGCTIKKVIRK